MKYFGLGGIATTAFLTALLGACAGRGEMGGEAAGDFGPWARASGVPAVGLSGAPGASSGASALTAENLRRHLYIFAHDSMMGRQPGTEGDRKATAYLAAELERLGLDPAGEDGTFFQEVPLVRRFVDEGVTRLAVGDRELAFGTDYLPALGFEPVRPFEGAEVVYGGIPGGEPRLRAEEAKGKIVVLKLAQAGGGVAGRGIRMSARGPLAGAVAIVVVTSDEIPAANLALLRRGTNPTLPRSGAEAEPTTILVPQRVGEHLFGRSLDELRVGDTGAVVRGEIAFRDELIRARNVIAVLPGSDQVLRDEYVAIGAHSDHIGARRPVDHDSLRAFNGQLMELQTRLGRRATAEERATIRVDMEALRRNGPVRLDSVANGADDDGSGSVSVLAIAEAAAAARVKPKRSLLFVWHTAEELGLLGSRWFTDHPTIPRDQIVAQLNMDMVGRGAEGDIPGGGPTYLQLVGSRRLSTELGDLVESVNRERQRPFDFDYTFDANGHPENIYCRSDHWNYARYGIPIVFFTTGLHKDYHQLTDEPQYIDYPHMADVARLVHDVALRVANLEHRVVVDGKAPAPGERCRQ